MTIAGHREPFRVLERTPAWFDFPRARAVVEYELGAHAPVQGARWKQRTPAYHAWHAFWHFAAALVLPLVGRPWRVRMHLAHGCCRALMALEQFVATFGRDHTPCPDAHPRKERSQ